MTASPAKIYEYIILILCFIFYIQQSASDVEILFNGRNSPVITYVIFLQTHQIFADKISINKMHYQCWNFMTNKLQGEVIKINYYCLIDNENGL